MKGIEKLEAIAPEQKKLLETSELNYKRFARIYFEVLSYDGNGVIVKTWQMENPAEKYLSSKELIDRARDVFTVVVPESKIHVRPVPYKKDDLKNLTVQSINAKIEELGLKPKDLVKLLDIDKSSLSLILSGERELSKANKAMFYYFFKSLEKEV